MFKKLTAITILSSGMLCAGLSLAADNSGYNQQYGQGYNPQYGQGYNAQYGQGYPQQYQPGAYRQGAYRQGAYNSQGYFMPGAQSGAQYRQRSYNAAMNAQAPTQQMSAGYNGPGSQGMGRNPQSNYQAWANQRSLGAGSTNPAYRAYQAQNPNLAGQYPGNVQMPTGYRGPGAPLAAPLAQQGLIVVDPACTTHRCMRARYLNQRAVHNRMTRQSQRQNNPASSTFVRGRHQPVYRNTNASQ